jgi:hypothetical protein
MAQLTRLTRVIDPDSRDWVMVKGERKVDPTLLSQVLFLIALEFNSSPAFPGLGSKFHLIGKITEDIDTVLSQEAERCLKPLTDANVIKDLNTKVTITEQPAAETLIEMLIEFKDAAGRPAQVVFTVSF